MASTRCDYCEKPIAGTSKDPVHCTSLGTHHGDCMHKAWAEKRAAEDGRRAANRAARSAAMKARHASGSVVPVRRQNRAPSSVVEVGGQR